MGKPACPREKRLVKVRNKRDWIRKRPRSRPNEPPKKRKKQQTRRSDNRKPRRRQPSCPPCRRATTKKRRASDDSSADRRRSNRPMRRHTTHQPISAHHFYHRWQAPLFSVTPPLCTRNSNRTAVPQLLRDCHVTSVPLLYTVSCTWSSHSETLIQPR